MPNLSRVERGQFGMSFRSSEFVGREEWIQLRAELVENSMAANPLLQDPTMTAYTPGETHCLLQRPDVNDWHQEASEFQVPGDYKTIALVPCAKTKPWSHEHSRRSSLYRAYHKIIELSDAGEIPPTYFVTVSEPLGIVPQDRWSDFLQYDNPGLFRDDYLRTGMVKSDWVEKFGDRKFLPFDGQKYQQCIAALGRVVGLFLKHHADHRIVAFVDNADSNQSTHQEMLDVAVDELNGQLEIERYFKREQPRTEPTNYILSKITRE